MEKVENKIYLEYKRPLPLCTYHCLEITVNIEQLACKSLYFLFKQKFQAK